VEEREQPAQPGRQHPGIVLWLTGVPSAGKSTLACAVGALAQRVRAVEILDGDEVRAALSDDLGFSRTDRDRNVRRIAFVAGVLARHGVLVVTAAISPYAAARDEARRRIEGAGAIFVEVFVSAGFETVVARDRKGLYRRALAGELAHFTGVSDPYEPPVRPDVIVHTDREPVEACVRTIVRALVARGALPESILL
jgi:adenylyl-sulfate kinase